MTEQLTEAVGTLSEAESIGGGRYRVLCISEGTGSSGTYPKATLQEAAQRGLIGRSTFAYLDHPSQSENRDRPERSVRDLAGVFTSEAVWDDAHNGLVAEMQVFAPYRQLIAEMADHIGLSIRGSGTVETIEGVRTVTSLDAIESVDWVTRAGRGGKVLSLLESARAGFDSADMAATAGVPNNATHDLPAVPVVEATPTPKEALVAELSEAEVTALRTSVTEAEAARDAALAEAATVRDRLALVEAKDAARPVVAAKVAESKTLGARTQTRVVESVLGCLPMADGKVDDTKLPAVIESAVNAAEAEIADYTPTAPAAVFGSFGSLAEAAESGTTTLTESDLDASGAEAFGRTPKGTR